MNERMVWVGFNTAGDLVCGIAAGDVILKEDLEGVVLLRLMPRPEFVELVNAQYKRKLGTGM